MYIANKYGKLYIQYLTVSINYLIYWAELKYGWIITDYLIKKVPVILQMITSLQCNVFIAYRCIKDWYPWKLNFFLVFIKHLHLSIDYG